MRRPKHLFSPEEFYFLHRIFLNGYENDIRTKGAVIYKKIRSKKGIGLMKDEIRYVKEHFKKWKRENQAIMEPRF